jgi:hypothetical protein
VLHLRIALVRSFLTDADAILSDWSRRTGWQRWECVRNLIMHNAVIVAEHHSLHGLRHNRSLNVVACKGLNGAQGLPPSNDLKFCSGGDRSVQYRCTNKASKLSELRKRFNPKMLNVLIGELTLAESLPVSRYHDAGSNV